MQNSTHQSERKTISITVPRLRWPSLQSAVLILLILAGAFQVIQLYALDQRIAATGLYPMHGASAQTGPVSGGSSSELPEMVGGC